MLFSSSSFLFLFLPILLYCWHKISSYPATSTKYLLFLFLASSLIFYALWGLGFLLLLLSIISLNFFIASFLAKNPALGLSQKNFSFSRKNIFILAIILNLLPLLWFKYSAFLYNNLALFLNLSSSFQPPQLPLGISFYTFIQLAWLCEVYNSTCHKTGLLTHMAFSCGFPWLISGPIVRQKEIAPQLLNLGALEANSCARGFALFSIGFAKKILLADSCGFYADNVFNAAQLAWPISSIEAWLASFLYTFQLYFDFSGYTDMALGLGLILGLKLPENFNSPYRASGIIDFWRRWHITLGAWLRDFIYIPLGGNRKGKIRQYTNLFLTMFLGGIWHGAGWTYILWGAMHGLMLAINHAWRAWKRSHAPTWQFSRSRQIFSILFTFLCINFCWTIFRSPSLDAALHLYSAMFSHPFSYHDSLHAFSLFRVLLPHHYLSGWQPFALILLCASICWFLPTSQQILNFVFDKQLKAAKVSRWAYLFALLAFMGLITSGRQASFLYFQF